MGRLPSHVAYVHAPKSSPRPSQRGRRLAYEETPLLIEDRFRDRLLLKENEGRLEEAFVRRRSRSRSAGSVRRGDYSDVERVLHEWTTLF